MKLNQKMGDPEAWIGLYSSLKMQPINLALKDTKFFKVSSSFGSIPLTQENFEEIEWYVCITYGFKRTCNINDVIKSMFEEKLKPTIGPHPLENIKSIAPTMFLLFKVLLEQQIKHAWFIAHLYKTAVETYPAINHTPTDFGWEPDKNHEYLKVKWFEGGHVPPQLELTDTNFDTEESEYGID